MPITVELTPLAPFLDGLTALRVEAGTRVADALKRLDIEIPAGVRLGIWGRPADETQCLREGDRIEFYRPLPNDPKATRRIRASKRSRR